MGPVLDHVHKRLSALLENDKFNVVEFVPFYKQYPLEQIAEVVIAVIGEKLAGGPVDDRKLLVSGDCMLRLTNPLITILQIERMIQVVSSFPEESKARKKVTGVLVDKLWNSLDHPPTSYVGDLHQFRQADGSNNVRFISPIYANTNIGG